SVLRSRLDFRNQVGWLSLCLLYQKWQSTFCLAQSNRDDASISGTRSGRETDRSKGSDPGWRDLRPRQSWRAALSTAAEKGRRAPATDRLFCFRSAVRGWLRLNELQRG